MFDELSPKSLDIINLMKFYSKNQSIKKIGSEYLLVAMYEQKDSLCKFLFSEYRVTKEELLSEVKKLNIIRKDDKEFTQCLESIFTEAHNLSRKSQISDEHIFMAILKTKSIAHDILINLGFDIEDLIVDVNEIYDFDKEDEQIEFCQNLTTLAKDEKLNVFVKRNDYINRMQVILKRKQKSNPLLIGNAGVGKTALIEGLALEYFNNKEDYEIISLNLASMLAGTKYRGDFEKRLEGFIEKIGKKKNVVLFIDEIHTIVGAGSTEGSLDVANILKPVLARGDFKLIGATTPKEYHKHIEKDKALSRRFQNVFITEPDKEETIKMLKGIKNSYIKHHNVNISDSNINYLVNEATRRIVGKYNPDKSIDILDEVLAACSQKNIAKVDMKDIDKTIDNVLGVKYDVTINNLNYTLLSKYFTLNNMGLLLNKVLLKLSYTGCEVGQSRLLDDLKLGFGVSDEMVLNLNLEDYSESHSLSSLIGTSPGYVGYQDEGILSGHILRYPLSIIVISNHNKGNPVIKNFINHIMKTGSFNDKKGNVISCQNTVFIIKDNNANTKTMGYFNNEKTQKENNIYDEYIVYKQEEKTTLNELYKKSLSKFNIDVDLMVDIISDNKRYIDEIVYELIKNKKTGKVIIYQDETQGYRYS